MEYFDTEKHRKDWIKWYGKRQDDSGKRIMLSNEYIKELPIKSW